MEIFNVLYHLAYLQSAPHVELSVFHGHPQDFSLFSAKFSLIFGKKNWWSKREITQDEKDAIKHYVQEPTTKVYQHPKEILAQKYANPHQFKVECIKKIKAWRIVISLAETIKDNRYCSFFLQCQSIMQSVDWNQPKCI